MRGYPPLLEFHNREAKTQWWSSFERQNKFEDDLIDDTGCLGGLQQVGIPDPEKRSLICSYRFPSQEYKLKVGAQAVDIAVMENAGTIVAIDEDACIVKIKRRASKAPLSESLSIGPPGPIDSKIIRSTIYLLCRSCSGSARRYPCRDRTAGSKRTAHSR